MKPELLELGKWLRSEAAERLKSAHGRRAGAEIMRHATVAELKAAKRMAETMHGHKLPGVTTDLELEKRHSNMQDRIAEKLEKEAARLIAWADSLATQ